MEGFTPEFSFRIIFQFPFILFEPPFRITVSLDPFATNLHLRIRRCCKPHQPTGISKQNSRVVLDDHPNRLSLTGVIKSTIKSLRSSIYTQDSSEFLHYYIPKRQVRLVILILIHQIWLFPKIGVS